MLLFVNQMNDVSAHWQAIKSKVFYCWIISHILLPGSQAQGSDNAEEGCEVNSVSFIKAQHEDDFLNSNSLGGASKET